jgi:chromosome partitioning protein
LATRRIIVLNQKGGVGKTTTVANLGACLAELGKTVLLVDVDPQANLSIHFGIEVERGEPSLYTLLRGEHDLRQVVRRTPVHRMGIIPSNVDLAGLSVELSDQADRLFKLRKVLDTVPGGFDYILMDSPPSLGLLTINAMCAATEVIIPLQTEFFALQGVGKLLRTVKLVRQNANKELVIGGVVACMYDSRTCLANEILADIREHFGAKVFNTIVRKNIRLAEAPGFGVPITQYDTLCRGAADYRALAEEVVAREAGIPGAGPAEETAGEDEEAEAAPPAPAPAAQQEGREPARAAAAAQADDRPSGPAAQVRPQPPQPPAATPDVPVEPPAEAATAGLQSRDAPPTSSEQRGETTD